jgi:hypothetical protein
LYYDHHEIENEDKMGIFFFICIEASKVIMQYVAEVSGKGENIDTVKEQLLQSNPVLEGKEGRYK